MSIQQLTPLHLYNRFAQESYQNSYDHGFWENRENRNRREMIMLMVNELSECQEAHRSGKHNPDIIPFERSTNPELTEDKTVYAEWYKQEVKGCTGEELADVVIRIFDYLVGWNFPPFDEDVDELFKSVLFEYDEDKNFSEDLLGFVEGLIESQYQDEYWIAVVCGLIHFCRYWNIDLEWHVEHKQRYNRTRPHKHGKAY